MPSQTRHSVKLPALMCLQTESDTISERSVLPGEAHSSQEGSHVDPYLPSTDFRSRKQEGGTPIMSQSDSLRVIMGRCDARAALVRISLGGRHSIKSA